MRLRKYILLGAILVFAVSMGGGFILSSIISQHAKDIRLVDVLKGRPFLVQFIPTIKANADIWGTSEFEALGDFSYQLIQFDSSDFYIRLYGQSISGNGYDTVFMKDKTSNSYRLLCIAADNKTFGIMSTQDGSCISVFVRGNLLFDFNGDKIFDMRIDYTKKENGKLNYIWHDNLWKKVGTGELDGKKLKLADGTVWEYTFDKGWTVYNSSSDVVKK